MRILLNELMVPKFSEDWTFKDNLYALYELEYKITTLKNAEKIYSIKKWIEVWVSLYNELFQQVVPALAQMLLDVIVDYLEYHDYTQEDFYKKRIEIEIEKESVKNLSKKELIYKISKISPKVIAYVINKAKLSNLVQFRDDCLVVKDISPRFVELNLTEDQMRELVAAVNVVWWQEKWAGSSLDKVLKSMKKGRNKLEEVLINKAKKLSVFDLYSGYGDEREINKIKRKMTELYVNEAWKIVNLHYCINLFHVTGPITDWIDYQYSLVSKYKSHITNFLTQELLNWLSDGKEIPIWNKEINTKWWEV